MRAGALPGDAEEASRSARGRDCAARSARWCRSTKESRVEVRMARLPPRCRRRRPAATRTPSPARRCWREGDADNSCLNDPPRRASRDGQTARPAEGRSRPVPKASSALMVRSLRAAPTTLERSQPLSGMGRTHDAGHAQVVALQRVRAPEHPPVPLGHVDLGTVRLVLGPTSAGPFLAQAVSGARIRAGQIAVPTGFEPATSTLTGWRARPSCSTGPVFGSTDARTGSGANWSFVRTPNGIRTRVSALKGRDPRPLDDGGPPPPARGQPSPSIRSPGRIRPR